MRKSIALFGCLALLSAPVMTGIAHAQGSSTTSTPGAGIMPGNGSTVNNGPDGDYDNTTAGSTMPVRDNSSTTNASTNTDTPDTKTHMKHRHTTNVKSPNMSDDGGSSNSTTGGNANNGQPGRGHY